MAKGFDERKPGALLSDDDTKSHYSKDYRPMTYEEAQAMRKRVRQEAIDNELQAVREKKFVQDHTVIRRADINDQTTGFYGEQTNTYNGNASDRTNRMSDVLTPDINLFREVNRTRPSNALDGLVIFCVFVFIFLSITVFTFKENIQYKKSVEKSIQKIETFEAVEGIVTKSHAISVEDYGNRLYSYTKWEIEYTFEYDNKKNKDDQIFSLSYADELGYISDDMVDKEITVYVNPNDVYDTLIVQKKPLRAKDWYPLFIAFLFLAVGIFIQWAYAKGVFTINPNGSNTFQLFSSNRRSRNPFRL